MARAKQLRDQGRNGYAMSTGNNWLVNETRTRKVQRTWGAHNWKPLPIRRDLKNGHVCQGEKKEGGQWEMTYKYVAKKQRREPGGGDAAKKRPGETVKG